MQNIINYPLPQFNFMINRNPLFTSKIPDFLTKARFLAQPEPDNWLLKIHPMSFRWTVQRKSNQRHSSLKREKVS
jgi:hypothetical protein